MVYDELVDEVYWVESIFIICENLTTTARFKLNEERRKGQRCFRKRFVQFMSRIWTVVKDKAEGIQQSIGSTMKNTFKKLKTFRIRNRTVTR